MPQSSTAIKAKLAVTHVGMPVHSATSEPIAAKPAKASGHHGLAGSGAWSSNGTSSFATSGVKPSERTASKIASIAFGSCVTVSTRFIKLNSISTTPGIPPSLERSSPSSVGQSICMMRIDDCIPCAVNLAPAKSLGALSNGQTCVVAGTAQQASSACTSWGEFPEWSECWSSLVINSGISKCVF